MKGPTLHRLLTMPPDHPLHQQEQRNTNTMTDDQRRTLERELWNIANTLRGKIDAADFRRYVLGLVFYKYLSERMH